MTHKVLLIEDSATQAHEIAASMSYYNIDVLIARDGPQGLRIAVELQPDLIVLDINLPTMSGYQVCRRLKRDPKTQAIPVVMLTSSDSPDAMMEGLDAGASDYIPKDAFASENLASTLQSLGLISLE
jgi:DNA-binding response OmpR family regulator